MQYKYKLTYLITW